MPKRATVLQFPGRPLHGALLSPAEARARARTYLDKPNDLRTEDFVNRYLAEPDTFLAICTLLKDICDASPAVVADEAARLYRWLIERSESVGLFDDRYYLLGESALITGGAFRLLGKRDGADLWFDRAEAGFRHTLNPAPVLATVAYARLTLHYDRRSYERLFELLPSLIATFAKANMRREALKCLFLEAMSLKECSRLAEARDKLEDLKIHPHLKDEARLRALVLVNLGELLANSGLFHEAVAHYREAMALETGQPLVTAHLKGVTADALRQQGHLAEAVLAYRAAIEDYAAAGMSTLVAYLRVVLSETLIALSRHREAEWEILAALPTIEEQKMLPEGFAALALLKESLRHRMADPAALRQVREYLKTSS